MSSAAQSFGIKTFGDMQTEQYRLFFTNAEGKAISPFHDIPLEAGEGVFNMVCEIPKWTNRKFEIATGEELNPIKQDTKKGKLRSVADVQPFKGYPWNYGAFPQTWEDPSHTNEATQALGDNDPLDVCEIGEAQGFSGQIKQVKVLGCLAMIDDGETDWKVLALDVNDPLASQVNNLADVEEYFPGVLEATYQWFRTYKIPAGKPENAFAFDGEWKDVEYTLDVVKENNEFWKRLISMSVEEAKEFKMCTVNATVEGSPGLTSDADALATGDEFSGPAEKQAADELTMTPSLYTGVLQRTSMFGNSDLQSVAASVEQAVAEAVKNGSPSQEAVVAALDANDAVGLIVYNGEAQVSEYNKERYVQALLVTVNADESSLVFGVYERRRTDLQKEVSETELEGRSGKDLIAAGYSVLANQGANLVFAAGKSCQNTGSRPSVNTYVYDSWRELFALCKTNLSMSTFGGAVAINTSITGQDGVVELPLGHLVADVNTLLNCGGVYEQAEAVVDLQQAAVLAYLVQGAGGDAKSGDQAVQDIAFAAGEQKVSFTAGNL